MNNVALIGRMVKDPELKYTTNNTPVLMFTVAIDRRKNEDGTHETDFIPVVAWKTAAELIAKYVSKGDKIGITGRIQSRSWETQDGTKRSAVEVIVAEVEFLGSKPAKPQQTTEAPTPEEDNCPF